MIKSIDTETYKGPGRFTTAYSSGSVISNMAVPIGLVGGGALTAAIAKPDGRGVTEFTQFLKEVGWSRHISGKGAMVVNGAIIGGIVVGLAGLLVGTAHGWNKAATGRKQFEALKSERDAAVSKLDALQNIVNAGPRNQQGYASAVSSDKEQTSTATR